MYFYQVDSLASFEISIVEEPEQMAIVNFLKEQSTEMDYCFLLVTES